MPYENPPLIDFAHKPVGHLITGFRKLRQKLERRIIELMRLDQFYSQIPRAMRQLVKN